jgi:hypothetical protein
MTTAPARLHGSDLQRHAGKFYGKYSGTVTAVDDEQTRGVITVSVPSVFGPGVEVRARPCLPYGHFFVPPVDAKVWIEFETGDLQYPIWVGTWYPVDAPPEAAAVDPPTNRVLHTDSGHQVEFDDTEDEERITITHAGGATIEIDAEGRMALTHAEGSTIEIASDGAITLTDAAHNTTLNSNAINLGDGASEPLVLGNKLVDVLNAIFQELATHTHPTGVGPSGPAPSSVALAAQNNTATLKPKILSMQNNTK